MEQDVTIDLSVVKEKEKQIRKFLESAPELLHKIGVFASNAIVMRTLSGRDYKEKEFKKYSAQYALYRGKKGRPVSPVDLFFTGRMQASLTYKIDSPSKGNVTLFFAGAEEGLKAAKNQRTRQFFKLSEFDVLKMTEIVNESIKGILQ